MAAYLRNAPQGTTEDDAPAPVSGTVRIKPAMIGRRFRVGHVIAVGGMSTIYSAEHLTLRTPVALKVLNPEQLAYPDSLPRFEQEGELLAEVARVTEHVVRPIDAGVHRGLHYLVMEHLAGETLWERVGRKGPLPGPEAASLITQAARGLTAVHGLRIVHRDVKPDNVFLCIRDGEPRIKLLDLGIAKKLGGAPRLNPTQPMGTVECMAPEQWTAGPVDARTDTWGLAVLAYHLITGRLPFAGASLHEVHGHVCRSDAPPPPVTGVAPDVASRLDVFFDCAFSRRPEGRFASAADLASAFAEAISG
jgi:serine/threonine protein kinase